MSGTSLAIEMMVCFVLTLSLLHYYGNWRKQHFLVTLAVFVAWFFSFIIVEVLPLDVSDVSVQYVFMKINVCFFSYQFIMITLKIIIYRHSIEDV